MNNSCPNCGTVYNITPQLIGKSTSCKKCGAQLVIDASGLQLAGGGDSSVGPFWEILKRHPILLISFWVMIGTRIVGSIVLCGMTLFIFIRFVFIESVR